MEKDVELLSRVAANHLYLGQFEALRAVLLSLRKRKPEIAQAILHTIVFEGGRFDGVIWSSTCSSPSHLAWLSALELLEFGDVSSFLSLEPELMRLKVEFLLLVQRLCSRASAMLPQGSADLDVDDRVHDSGQNSKSMHLLHKILDLGLTRLKSDVADVIGEHVSTDLSSSDEELKGLWDIVLDQPEILDVMCWNIQKQVRWSKPGDSDLALSVAGVSCGGIHSSVEGLDTLVGIQRNVQMAHLGALKQCMEADHIAGAISHLRFLHLDLGLEDFEYRMPLHALIKRAWSYGDCSGGEHHSIPDEMLMIYTEALSSNCMKVVHMIQVIQDELRQREIEQIKVSDDNFIPLPLQKYLEVLNLKRTATLDDETCRSVVVRSCMKEIYHYARISGSHVLECIMETALSFVKREQLQETSDVLSLFPLLQPLVAVMGWDLLPSKTAMRRKLLQILWTSKSQVLRLEEFSFYGKQSDEISCVEYLCDLLCFHLDLASFVACVNSGGHWDSKSSLLLSGKGQTVAEDVAGRLDSFVENFVLERLAVQTPMRVLFDVVPGIKFKDAVELISMQPIPSKSAAWKRLQDIELMHVRYALESTVLALGAMERCLDVDSDNKFSAAVLHLKDLKNHIEAVNNVPRKIFVLSIIISLLHMNELSATLSHCASPRSYSASQKLPESTMVVSFTRMLLDILHNNLPSGVPELDGAGRIAAAAKQALEWRISNVKFFTEDWEWRLSVLQRLIPLSDRPWGWKEALAILRAAPSKLLNLCMQRAKYDIGEEAVHRFSLPPEDRAALELAEWVAGAFKRVLVEDAVSRVAEGTSNEANELDFASFRDQLGAIPAILLCIDVAATSARSTDMCKLLLDQARGMLSEIYPGGSPRSGSAYWDQIQDVTIISVTRRVLQRLHDLLELEKAPVLQEIFSGSSTSPVEPFRQGQKQRALAILHQIIDDAHRGKRQFLSGKLHNLARAVADEVADGGYFKGEGLYIDFDKKNALSCENGIVLGHGLRTLKSANLVAENSDDFSTYDKKDTGRRFFGPLSSKPPTYLSAFVIYIATIGDIVDGLDTTHDFNFFSLIYEWPKDLLTRLVFERGSTDAASKVADIMYVDFVHEVISACVPPVFPPRSGHGWACVPVLPSLSRVDSEIRVPFQSLKEAKATSYGSPSKAAAPTLSLYPLKLDIVKHLAKLSPVRAILACVFGSSILSSNNESSLSSLNGTSLQVPDAERLFYEFALDQSERFPTLNRWIQMQSNLHRVSESAIAATSDAEVAFTTTEPKHSVKRLREPESDTESEVDDVAVRGNVPTSLSDFHAQGKAVSDPSRESPKSYAAELDPMVFLSLDCENEGPYEKAVERLINEGKLMDALALSDRCLRCGASDRLLQLLIEHGEENTLVSGYPHSFGVQNFWSNSWQHCLRLKDKQLAARLALKYLHRWELDAAMDVLMMCSCHLPQSDPIRNEVLQVRRALQRYKHILSADDHYSSWQEVEADCKEDPEGLALRLAGKGAVSEALEVAESASLSIDLRRELQGRQLVKLLIADPLSGGGPAEASRFLSSLSDPDDALPVAIGAMQLLPDLRSKQLLVHFFLKRRAGSLSDLEIARLNSWAMGLGVLAVLPLPWQQRCSALHEHPHLILEVLLMMKQLPYASMILRKFTSLCDDSLILTYASKAISVNVNAAPREPRISVSGPRSKQKTKTGMPSRSNFTNSLSNFQKEARRAFSWTPRETASKSAPKEVQRKRKSSGLAPSERVSWEAMAGIQEERISSYSADAQERPPFVSVTEEWVLTGDPNKDAAVRSSHKYESSPDIILFRELLSLCSDESISAKGALELCVSQMKNVLYSQQLPLHASMETIGRAYHATETFVQALIYAKNQLRKLAGGSDLSSNSERSRDTDDASAETGSSSVGSQYPDELSELIAQADFWLGRAELLQSLLGSGIIASFDDIADNESSVHLRDRLIEDERYSMAVYTCKKCKIDAFPVWNAWGHALIRMEHYAQARVKFKQALQLHKGDPAPVVLEIINTMEGGPPVDVSAVRSMYEHLAKSASTILDDSLSADAYLNVLYMPSTFPRSERSRQSQRAANNQLVLSISDFEDGPRSNLDNVRYVECIHYLQEYARSHMLNFMFRHGHYADACILFFPPNAVPSIPQPSNVAAVPSSSPQRPDPLVTDYGTIDDLCELCIGYGAMAVLEDVLSANSSIPQDPSVSQYTAAALVRICNYSETHRHFNYLYKFQVIRGDHVAAGLCCIQLFMNSTTQEEAIKHLEHAKTHFEEGLSARHRAGEATKLASKTARGKSAAGKLSEEGLVKFSARVAIQVEVVRAFNDTDKCQWKYSLFGNPNDPETFRRRCQVAEILAEKNFDLAFQVIYEFNLPAVDIYAGVAASLAERKKGSQLTEFFRNIKGTIDEDDWDQVLGAAINVYANKHKERPIRMIDMLSSSHRKVLACVICGRLKSAFQIASRSGSIADVQYVAHQALHANALPVLDMCKQWLAQYM
uniref:Zinc finger FYVE domain-containing protein 26 n=1 Tax=Anthurium amnicola TaxID=1678845 RepID=A0A1D1Z361_9ARAE